MRPPIRSHVPLSAVLRGADLDRRAVDPVLAAEDAGASDVLYS